MTAEQEEEKAASSPKKGTAGWAVATAQDHLAELTDRPIEQVVGIERTDDGWTIQFEIVELHRVPDSTDVLALYELELDDEGELTSYRRKSRYSRGQEHD